MLGRSFVLFFVFRFMPLPCPHWRFLMKRHVLQAAALFAMTTSALAQSRVIITEIMYNPGSNEKNNETEWVEIANVGTQSIQIKDWRLDDEDKTDWGKFSCTLAPGGVVVLVNAAAVKEEQFRAAWDVASDSAEPTAKLNYQVIAVKWGGLANSPSADNEILQLLNEKDEVVCEVKQAGKWPSGKDASIYLTDIKAASLSDGSVWRRSAIGYDGARANAKTNIFDGDDIGSPGYVPGLNGAPPASPHEPSTDGKKPRKPKADKPADTPDGKDPAPGSPLPGNKPKKNDDAIEY
jgi:hypothetical protein